jgi:hypothetical protein
MMILLLLVHDDIHIYFVPTVQIQMASFFFVLD